jgi:thiol peroxidase
MADVQNSVTFQGNPLTLTTNAPKVGDPAPDFEVLSNDLSPVTLSSLQGKIRIIISVPSLDTPVCDTEVRTFNEHATSLSDDVAVMAISMDLPFAQARWCGAAGIQNVQTLSDHLAGQFGEAYGVLIKELRLLARAVFVVDKEGVIRYIQIVDELTNEPDYEAAFKALKEAR